MAGHAMTGDAGRQGFEAMLPQAAIDRRCQEVGVIQRQRKLPLGMLGRALVGSAGTPGGAYQADVLRSSLACEGPPVARSAFQRGVDAPLARGRAALADRALAQARAHQGDLSGPLGGVPDWQMVDATTVRGRDALRQECPGPGGYAAMKGQNVLSGGCGAPVPYHVRPARAHDSRPLPLDDSWRGYGL